MDFSTCRGILRGVLIAGAFFCAANPGLAQTKTAQPKKPETAKQVPQAPGKAWIKDPNQVMPMRQMTNAQRRAAAERSRSRRAKAETQRRLNNKTQNGVQQ